jgi:hypothetical protein
MHFTGSQLVRKSIDAMIQKGAEEVCSAAKQTFL